MLGVPFRGVDRYLNKTSLKPQLLSHFVVEDRQMSDVFPFSKYLFGLAQFTSENFVVTNVGFLV